MSAKTNFAAILCLILSSVSQAQQTSSLQLNLEPPSVSKAEQNEPDNSLPAQSPRKIARSVLEIPPMQKPVVVVPTVEPFAETPKGLAENQSSVRFSLAAQKLPGTPDTGTKAELVRERFPNGSVRLERWVTEDTGGNWVNHGEYIEYDEQGNRVTSGHYVFGRRDGEWTKQITKAEAEKLVGTIDSGFAAPFQSNAEFKNDLLDGRWTVTDSSGKRASDWNYVGGKRNGQSMRYHSRGDVVRLVNYRDDLSHGKAKLEIKDEATGELQAREIEVVDGLYLRRIDHWYPAKASAKPNTLRSQEMRMVQMPYNIVSSDWNTNTVEYQKPGALESVKHGLSMTFYADGRRESEGNYDMGKRHGAFAWWYPNGQQKTVGEYQDDAEQGAWMWWHENGIKQATGMFQDGERVAQWSAWSADGKLVGRINTDNVHVAEKVDEKSDTKR